ncbi:MAG: (d)CMP kinase [Kiritimatiellaeota bacterium]|nr:(d)CMP kinase [Kiritimatiellota bacterium]
MGKANVIAIDGPAASGKSSVAAAVAERLNIPYVNTGNMYRAVALAAMSEGYETADSETKRLEILSSVLKNIKLEYVESEGILRLLLDGENVEAAIRTPDVAEQVSAIAAVPEVRSWLVDLQRKFAELGLIVMEGRDIGTIVFPNADYKFFLTASPEIRAKRRLEQSGETFDGATLESVAAKIAKRDEMDTSRAVAPLRKANDAVLIDSSDKSLEQVVELVVSNVEAGIPRTPKMECAMGKTTTMEYRVAYADTDKMGVVYYANYLVYFERLRNELLRDAGLPYAEMEKRGVMLPVVEAVCNYKKAAEYDDLLTISGWVEETGKTHVKICCEVRKNGNLLVSGHTVHVCVDIGTWRPIRFPEFMRSVLERRTPAR